jgi:hypothetical protein
MTERHKIRSKILTDRLSNPENLWIYPNIYIMNNLDLNLLDTTKIKIDTKHLSLSKNPTLTIDFINNNKDKCWYWDHISQNTNITLDIITNNPNLPWSFKYVGLNKNITWENILNNPDYPWNWTFLTHYKSITWSIIKQNIDLFKQRLLWNEMGCIFDFEILENLGLSVPWNFQNLSYFNPNINWDIVIKYKDQNWNWDALSDSENLDWNIIVEYIYKPWNWKKISLNLKLKI